MTKFFDDNAEFATTEELENEFEVVEEEENLMEVDFLMNRSFDAHVGRRMSDVMDRFHSVY